MASMSKSSHIYLQEVKKIFFGFHWLVLVVQSTCEWHLVTVITWLLKQWAITQQKSCHNSEILWFKKWYGLLYSVSGYAHYLFAPLEYQSTWLGSLFRFLLQPTSKAYKCFFAPIVFFFSYKIQQWTLVGRSEEREIPLLKNANDLDSDFVFKWTTA